MSGNKALRRALETADVIRINANLPLIVDTTELWTPDMARDCLNKHNKFNRPVNWKKAHEYAADMKAGKWALTPQGLVFDQDGNLLTGQTRLWAVVFSGVSVYFRVSRGNPSSTAKLLDRGRPQTARDLASRDTERPHSPTESSIARAIAILKGLPKPSVDQLADIIALHAVVVGRLLRETHRIKKTRSLLMILAAIAVSRETEEAAAALAPHILKFAERLDLALAPETADHCWGKSAAFLLAMNHAKQIVSEA